MSMLTVSPIKIVKNKIVTSKNENKRSLSSSSSSPSQSPPIVTSKKTKLFFTPNRFAPLSTDDVNYTIANNNVEIDTQSETSNQGQQNTTDVTPKIILPPSIFIKGVHDYLGLRNHLTEVSAPDSFSCKSTTTHLKIQADTPNSYRNIIHYLKETNAQYHTYQPQSDKPLRVVIRNLHPSTPEADIASAIAEIGHTVRNVTNVRHQQTKTPLPLFFVDLDPNDSDSDIFSITSLLHTKIKIEEPYKKRQIPQCQNCQSYGHTRTYCAHNPKCVKCGGNHLSTTCPKSPELPAKCALCEGAHPANYKGCTIYKQLTRKHNNLSRKKSQQPLLFNSAVNVEQSQQHPPATEFSSTPQPRSYANVTEGHLPPKPNPMSSNNNESELLKFINDPTSKSLLILTWNSNGLANHKNEILATLQNNRIDIALISETHFTNSSNFYLPGYQTFKTNHPDGTAHAGAAIIVRSSLIFYPLPKIQSHHIQACGISLTLNNIPINIYAAYLPPRHTITHNQLNDFFSTLGQKFIIGGDFNAKHIQWGCRTNNPRGNTLKTLTYVKNYKIHAPPYPTYWPSSPRKSPDILDIFITKIPNGLYTTVTNLDDLCSDHSSVLFTIDTAPLYKPDRPNLIQGQMDWDKFKSLLESQINLKVSLKSTVDIDDAVNHLIKSIQDSAWSSSSPLPPKDHTKNLPLHIRVLISEKRKARSIWQRTKYPSDKRKFNNHTNKLKRTLASIRSENFTRNLVSLSTADNSLWQTTRKILRSRPHVPPLKKADGSWAITDLEKANIFSHHLATTFQPHNNLCPIQIETVNRSLLCALPMTLPPKHIRPSEVEHAIQKSPRRKTPGYDLITSEVAVKLPKKALLMLTHIYNSMLRLSYFPLLWKFSVIIMILKPGKPPDSPKSYRPISLLPLFSKIFEKIILKRILPLIESNLPNNQFGFRHNHSTIHQIHRLVDNISYALEKKLIFTGVFLDVAQAFDTV
ncbi:hypothetical protein QTP88_018516 [Uroleucon formosanum]